MYIVQPSILLYAQGIYVYKHIIHAQSHSLRPGQ